MILNVLGRKIPVKFKDKPTVDDSDVHGYYDKELQEIVIDKNIKSCNMRQTIIHESFHAVTDRIHGCSDIEMSYLHIIIDTFATVVDENFEQLQKIKCKKQRK
jgi:Zn-dependent peptidase ImmA (M78 family)